MKGILDLIKLLFYSPILSYHIKKKDKYNMSDHPTLMKYHYEKSNYYYEKAYGVKFGEKE